MERNWTSTVAGILDIIAGVSSLIGSAVLALLAGVIGQGAHHVFDPPAGWALLSGSAVFAVCALMTLVFGVLAVIGGIFSLQRRRWAWALIGAIAAVFSFFPLGIPAIILIVIAEKDFARAS